MDEKLSQRVETLRREFEEALDAAGADAASLEELRIRFFGKKGGLVPALFGELKNIAAESRREAGAALNSFRDEVQSAFEAARATAETPKKTKRVLDVTLPGRKPATGHLHPITQVRREVEAIFVEMGYTLMSGPEIETDWYNFEALNFPPEHPARDEQDTFYLDGSRLLRTHTSNAQIRAMEDAEPPIKVISSGRVFRRDEITLRRSPMFHQIEGLLVDEGIHFGHLKGTLEHFLRHLFDEGVGVRFRPSYFPFTEPSAEVDISCLFCGGDGCGTCSQTGWMEILGCGMVHPNVLRNVEIDPERYTGFAFGMGIDRVAMLRFGLPNIRALFENDLRVLRQL